MGKKKTVLKVDTSTKKHQQEILSAVAKITGVDKMEVNGDKGTLTVVGEVEPVPIFKALSKIGQNPEIVTVGPPRPERTGPYWSYHGSWDPYGDQQQQGRSVSLPSPRSPCRLCINSSYCRQCELIALGYPLSSDPYSGCSIL